MKKAKICVLGSLNVDLTVSLDRFHAPGETVSGTDFKTFTGGKGGNQAVAAAKLGADVSMIGCVGEDSYGDIYLNELDKNGIDRHFVRRLSDAPTGIALIEVDTSGENRIAVVAGANKLMTCDMVGEAGEAIAASDYLLIQLEVPIEAVTHAAALARSMGVKVILDPAPAPTRSIPDALLMLCDYVTPNEHELRALTGLQAEDEDGAIRACEALTSRGARAVINKRGARGALVVSGGVAQSIPAYEVKAIDTTAAGDTFNAALAVGLSMDMDLPDAVRLANAAAGLSTTAAGAQSAMPALSSALSLCCMT